MFLPSLIFRQGDPASVGPDLPALNIPSVAAIRAAAPSAATAGADCLCAKVDDYVFPVVPNMFGRTNRRPLRVARLAPVRCENHRPADNVVVCGLCLVYDAIVQAKDHLVVTLHWDAKDAVLESSLVVLREANATCGAHSAAIDATASKMTARQKGPVDSISGARHVWPVRAMTPLSASERR